jgi:hypothetical protein
MLPPGRVGKLRKVRVQFGTSVKTASFKIRIQPTNHDVAAPHEIRLYSILRNNTVVR